ncbi:hypothetical protein ACFL19_01865 [Pseudomonadota bacterium]
MRTRIYISLFIVCLISQIASANPDESGKIIVDGNYKYLVGTLPDDTTKKLEVAEELNSKFGVLRTAFDRVPYGLEFYMFLDGKLIQNGVTEIYGVYYIGDQPWVLVGSHLGGMNPNNLSFLKINTDKSVTKITFNKPFVFVSYEQDLDVKVDGNRLVVDLGFEDQKQKLAVLENDQISIEYKEVKSNEITTDDCQKLYRIANSECTWEHRRNDCQNNAIGMIPSSNADMGSFDHISSKPGFDQKGFDRECLQACKRGVVSEYETFSKSACGYGN